eukprot:1161833-Pelagomonas_calceolata.AAC.30
MQLVVNDCVITHFFGSLVLGLGRGRADDEKVNLWVPHCSPPHCCCCFRVCDCRSLRVLAPAIAAMKGDAVGKAAGKRQDEVWSSGALLTYYALSCLSKRDF